MYMPKLTRGAAEHRLGAADFAAARRERAVAGAGRRILARLGCWIAAARRAVRGAGVPGRRALQMDE
jgi:hypothetical protein